MKIVVAGKGGSGKTTVTAVLARSLARRGREVIAIDADANPNLGFALGLGPATTDVLSIKNGLLDDHHGHEHSHEHNIDEVIDQYAVSAPDGVRLLQTGTVERPSKGCLCCGSHATVRDVFERVPAGGDHVVIADLEAGLNDLLWARPHGDDVVVLVVDSSRKSHEVARRVAAVATELGVSRIEMVANRMESADDLNAVRSAFPEASITDVPDDGSLRDADRQGSAALDVAPDSPAVKALVDFANRL
jgi:CO dehydrogenase maturation factor